MMTLLQTTFVVLAGITFFVLATVADPIHTIRKIVVYWYRLLPTDTQNQFLKIKKKQIQTGAQRAATHDVRHWGTPRGRSYHRHAHREGDTIRVGSGRHHRAQWRRLAAARSRSASARGRSAPLGLEPPPQASSHAVAIIGGGREEAHTAWPRSATDRPQSTTTDTEERLHLQHGAGGGHHRGRAHERATVEVGVEEGADEVIPHGDGAEDLRGRER
jgi:hypothetical protein